MPTKPMLVTPLAMPGAHPRAVHRSSRRAPVKVAAKSGNLAPSAQEIRKNAPKAIPPPTSFNFREKTQPMTMKIVESRYPELLDLATEGVLIVVPRREDYVERRTDGYQEPEEVFIVATAHISVRSKEHVRRVVAAVQPENVVVELCRSRQGIMFEDAGGNKQTMLGITGDNFFSAMARTLQLGGGTALTLRFALDRLTSSAMPGAEMGGEFKEAYRAAQDASAQMVLGDRPVEVTLDRCWAALDWGERARLAADLVRELWELRAGGGMSQQEAEMRVDAIRQDDDVLAAMLGSIASRYPSLVGPLWTERDTYLAWSLKRSKAVNGTQRVVGVLGQAHLRGVVWALTSDQGELRFRDLAGRRRKKLTGPERARRLAVELGVFGGLWYAWEAVTNTPMQ